MIHAHLNFISSLSSILSVTLNFHFLRIRNENFYEEDIIQISARNRNGKNDLAILFFAEPFNDPPFIQVPQYIALNATGYE